MLRGAIIGLGFIASKGHLPAYLKRKDVELVAVTDICPARFDLVKDLKNVRCYTNAQEMLEKEGKNLDFVDIASPAATHADYMRLALSHNLHVLCEKPFTTTLNDAKKVIELGLQNKKVIFPCHNYHYAPVVQEINRIIKSGKIGKVKSVHLNTMRNTHAKGVKEWKTDWRRYKEYSGGGIAMDHGSHSLYLIFNWLGSYPTQITTHMSNLSEGKYDTEDNFNATAVFPTGLASLTLSWTAGVRKVIYSVQGDRGAIIVDDDDVQVAMMKENSSVDISHAADWDFEKYSIASHWMDSGHSTWFNPMFDQFVQCIEKKDYLNKELQHAYFCVQTITKAYESANHGSKVLDLENRFPLL